jgi:hypothetical protein
MKPLEETVAEILQEAFDKPYKWSPYSVQDDHIILRFKTSDNRTIDISFRGGIIDTERWTIDFEDDYGFDASDEGDAFRIFATVIDAIKWFIKEKDPKEFWFAAEKPDTVVQAWTNRSSREKLYDRMAKKFSSKINYKLSISKQNTGTEYYFEKK